jgi:hypothetical protein
LIGDALEHRSAPIFQLGQVLRAVSHIAELHFIQPAGHFLAVARNEGERIPFAEELQCALHRRGRERQFTRNGLNKRRSHQSWKRGVYAGCDAHNLWRLPAMSNGLTSRATDTSAQLGEARDDCTTTRRLVGQPT